VTVSNVQKTMLNGTRKYAEQIGLAEDPMPYPAEPWISWCGPLFKKDAHTPARVADIEKNTPTSVSASLLCFDEKTGEKIPQDVDGDEVPIVGRNIVANKAATTAVAEASAQEILPWKEWLSRSADLGRLEAVQATVVMALHQMHTLYPIDAEDIEVVFKNGKPVVCCTKAKDCGNICIPACIPKQSKVFNCSDHPNAVRVRVKTNTKDHFIVHTTAAEKPNSCIPPTAVAEPEEKPNSCIPPNAVAEPEVFAIAKPTEAANDTAEDDSITGLFTSADVNVAPQNQDTSIETHSRCDTDDIIYVLPEFKFPADLRTAEQRQASAPIEWEWGAGGVETMHPFWAVRRILAAQLKMEQDRVGIGASKPRFNCKVEARLIHIVGISAPNGVCLNMTRIVELPFIVNTESLRMGEELILEMKPRLPPPATQPKPVKRTWREQEAALSKNGKANVSAVKSVAKKKTKTSSRDVS
jgi:hypothetical protein